MNKIFLCVMASYWFLSAVALFFGYKPDNISIGIAFVATSFLFVDLLEE